MVKKIWLAVVLLIAVSCLDQQENLQLTELDQLKTIELKNWFETNKAELLAKEQVHNARMIDKNLILPFFEKEPDWSKFSEYYFPDGRKVYEINISQQSGIMPTEFHQQYGDRSDELIEETMLFVEKNDGTDGYAILTARYFSYGEKSKGMTYHKIPKNWSGRIDMFSYGEKHLIGFEVEKGRLSKHFYYQTEEPEKSNHTANLYMTYNCSGYWFDFPFHGFGEGHVNSLQSIWVNSCTSSFINYGEGQNINSPMPSSSAPSGNGRPNPEFGGGSGTGNNYPFPGFDVQIDMNGLTNCHQLLINTLIGSTKEEFKKIFEKFEGNSLLVDMNFNVKFKYVNSGTATAWTHPQIQNNAAVINIHQGNNAGATDLSIARTIMHEMLHAYLLFIEKFPQSDRSLNGLLNAYLDKYNVSGNVNYNAAHHNLFVEGAFINDIAEELKTFASSLNYPQSLLNDEQFFKDMAWGGLQDTDVYQQMTSAERDRISRRYYAERNGITYQGTAPKGDKACQ
ncbi:hypothetical protein ACFOUP_03700 [Belliella kenyensis]|uniref:SprT-like family protein n=1 Tax=Belliella kenyensis TaxID=1472724 RepID=A0ABV8EHI2_9BACT|nr:hypothetical protein [Belliella kenyensis]MCH7403710.1 hypothetical protein [Belliella kenyensis]MDN3603477.1 hypothetical protein [Belliella kenyensis]